MLDRASIERLSKTPEKNAPMLNVALAEEGPAAVLLLLSQSPAVGPEALEVIATRIEREGESVGRDPFAAEESFVSPREELDRRLIGHPNAPGAVRDAVLGRHMQDAFFVLAAACHRRPTQKAIEAAVDWPSASPVHDRPWLALLDPEAIAPLTFEEWAQDTDVRKREAAARLSRDPAIWNRLLHDQSRTVRRALASNKYAGALSAELARNDMAPEVRVRAAASLAHRLDESDPPPSAMGADRTGRPSNGIDTARFAAAERAMRAGGTLSPDVVRTLSSATELDDEGALLAAQVLPRPELAGLVDAMVDLGLRSPRGIHLAAGLGLRPSRASTDHRGDSGSYGELTEIAYDAVKALSRCATSGDRLTGKARLAAWTAEGLRACCGDAEALLATLSRGSLGGDRMIFARTFSDPTAILRMVRASRHCQVVPAPLLELAWADKSVSDAEVIDLAPRIAKPKRRADDLPEDEIDLDPSLRPLPVLEKVVLVATLNANVAPRAALTVVAMDSRRVRYVLSALPQWKGRLAGGRLARVLRQHAAALSAAAAEARARVAKVETWTERMMSETEMAVALAVGHLTSAEVVRRIVIGRQAIDDGLSLVSGAEARAALEGPAAIQPIVEWASKNRLGHPAALAMWLLLEAYDRQRPTTLIASSLDGLSAGKGVVPPSACDALSILERRSPGRLETIHPQSPRGRATLASAIARAYRSVGGMREELKTT